MVTLLACCRAAAAQSPEPALPRVIYGETTPQVIYGPASPAPEPPRRAEPANPPPIAAPQPPTGTSLTYGWVPAGPPVWHRPPLRDRPPPPNGIGFRPPPAVDNRVERPPPFVRPPGPALEQRPGTWFR